MANMFDYLKWRGDLLFAQDPPNAIDGLIFSSLIYLRFGGRILEHPEEAISLREAAEEFLAQDNCISLARSKYDIELLRQAADSERFGQVKITMYRNFFAPEQDTQFAAATFLLDDGSLFVSFRGTDNTLTGWKEDFNMCFQQTIPAQRLAHRYVGEVHAEHMAPMRLCGHSKGGNLAVFAAARSSPLLQQWILDVYNNDGPGFSKYLMGDPGYLAIVPKITTIVPQSSVIGMIMDREEPCTVIKSTQVSLLQHDPYSWEVLGKCFVPMEGLTSDSVLFNKTIKNWLAGMTNEERNRMVDVFFGLLESGDVKNAADVFHLKNIHRYLKTIGADPETRKVLYSDFHGLVDAARIARNQISHEEALLPEPEASEYQQ